ncbi:MAG: hypothetical protein ACKVOQ_11810 [Cyclobacteriaceae bacterium]
MATRGAVATGLSTTSPRSFLAVGFPLLSLAGSTVNHQIINTPLSIALIIYLVVPLLHGLWHDCTITTNH